MKKNTTLILMIMATLSILAPALTYVLSSNTRIPKNKNAWAPPEVIERCINLCKYYKNSSLIPIKCFSNSEYWPFVDWNCGIDNYCPKNKHNIILYDNCTIKTIK